jgi:two-component system, OmpR family, sensor histidine kinase KdpD
VAEQRPDPDRVLARIQAESPRGTRGMLKVFFGYAAGVGKTYAMLEAARAQAAAGGDVVVGYVETHGRAETDALLEGIETLPRREVLYRGITLREFDLDAALARKPAILVVDELAHTNAPEMRHAKRWQDIEELRDASISVFTTMNVQHLESLNDVIAQITGVTVRETVPDTVLESADRIELVDLPPDDLIQRLREGKVYLADQVQRATERFFQRPNLIALRELALRRTAERVDEEAETARLSQTAPGTWPTVERLLVCVGPSPSSTKVVRGAKRLASALRADWIAVTVETPKTASLSARSRHVLEYNLSLAERLGAEVVTLHGGSVAQAIVEYARVRNATKIVVGKTLQSRWLPRLRPSMTDQLLLLSDDIDLYVVRGVEEPREDALPPPGRKPSWPGYLRAAILMALCTALADLFHGAGLAEANVVMTFLLGIVLTAARYGIGPGIFASFAGVLLFDFFYVPPYGTFAVADVQYFITFAVMLGVALLTSTLTARIRRQAHLLQQRGLRTEALLHLSQVLASTWGIQALASAAERQVHNLFRAQAAIFLPQGSTALVPATDEGKNFSLDPRDAAVARWVFDHGRMAGAGTDTLPRAAALYLPLEGPQGTLGVLGLRQAQPSHPLAPDPKHLLEAVATQIALAIGREKLAEAAPGADGHPAGRPSASVS